MRACLGCEKIGAVGYCFGAKYVVRFLKPAEKRVDVGYVAHPSFVDTEELAAIQGPLSISAAETDAIFPPRNVMRPRIHLLRLPNLIRSIFSVVLNTASQSVQIPANQF
ncbi:hypothetical protein VTN96DRAFT_8636 [Rasamsonia emersonii]